MSKEIDINDEEQILKECDFDYFYNSEKCSRELCMFYNDISQNENFDKRQAYIDLGRIGITLKEQDQKIKELEHRLSNCIELPKYEKGQKIYYIRGGKIEEAYFQRFNNWITADVILNPHEVTDDDGYTDVDYDFDMVSPEQMFLTEEEAKTKLEELQDGK